MKTRKPKTRRQKPDLDARRPGRRQVLFICHLADVLKFDPADFAAWLERHFHVRGVGAIRDAGQARKIIAAMMRIKDSRKC